MKHETTILGIDIGTTKVAACIINANAELLAASSKPHHADLETSPARSEQDVTTLINAAYSAIYELPHDLRANLKAIGITGQMHGTCLLDENSNPLTPLITWQDNRCLENDFLQELNKKTGHNLSTGLGCATLAWLITNDQFPSDAESACTIHDFFVMKLAALDKPVTDTTNAASWGLFDLRTLNWDFNAVEKASIPAELLPEVLGCGCQAGTFRDSLADELNIPAGIPVAAAIGDSQASLLATLKDPEHQLTLTLGTGGQLSAVLPPGSEPKPLPPSSKYDYRPFPNQRLMLSACCLAGGSAWAWLARTVQNWLKSFHLTPPPTDQLYELLNDLGLKATETFQFHPHFAGERYAPNLKASIEGLNLNNFDLGTVSRSLAKGIMKNLKDMLPAEAFQNRTEIVASGNALRLNPLLQEMAREVFELPLTVSNLTEEAACGAAINAT